MLINDVLGMSKIEAGRMTLKITGFDLWHTLKHLEALIRIRAERKGVQFTVTRASNVPQSINASESRLRQTLNSGFNVWTVRMWRGKYAHIFFT